MSKIYLQIKVVQRVLSDGTVEELSLNAGVNVITGGTNSGKSVWLKQIDFILGKNKNIADAFSDEDLAKKYTELRIILEVNGTEIIVGRKPLEMGLATKVFYNDEVINITNFSERILKTLNIKDDIKYPRGNPYTTQWVELGFRSLLRHIYRRESYWSDIADKQPINEQHAAQYQFFGIADKIYSKEYDNNVTDEKRLAVLQAQKDQYNTILNRIAVEMAPKGQEILNYASEIDINTRIERLENELVSLQQERDKLVAQHLASVLPEQDKILSQENDLLTDHLNTLNKKEETNNSISQLIKRKSEYVSISETLSDEIAKLNRTKKSGIIANLKITHCPACDQPTEKLENKDESAHCFLCHQKIEEKESVINKDRIDFEINQVNSEAAEVKEIISTIEGQVTELEEYSKELTERLYYIDRELKPLRDKLFALTHQDLAHIDVHRGRVEEQIQNYKRLLNNVKYRQEIASQISSLTVKIDNEKKLQDVEARAIPFGEIAEDLRIAMQFYVNGVSSDERQFWTHKGQITVGINDTRVTFFVNNKPWDSLGSRDKDIFFLAYHFGLLSMTEKKKYQYPGIVLIDLPAELGQVTEDSYNLLIQPFIRLCKKYKKTKHLQVIVAGRSFKNLTDANIIELENYIPKPLAPSIKTKKKS